MISRVSDMVSTSPRIESVLGAVRIVLVVAATVSGWSEAGAAATRKPLVAAATPALPEEANRLTLGGATVGTVASAARVTEVGGVTRLSFDLDRGVDATAFLLERPDRVIVDVPEVNFQLPADAGSLRRGVGVVRSFRFGLFAPGRSRIVVDLAAPATIRRVSTEPLEGSDGRRLVVELARADRAAFKAAVHGDPAPGTAAAPQPVATSDSKEVVVIDPGHGGVDPGASGLDGLSEKRVVFDFAAALAARLEAGGHYKVVMTRKDDTFVSLSDRVKIARDAGAALFISVHADSLADPAVAGATVYTSSDRASDAEAARLAAGENRADELAGVQSSPDLPGVDDILFDLTRRETRTYSHLYQRTLAGYWQKIAHLNKNPQRAAGFKVLQAPDVPSVLLELGYLSSRADSRMLTSAAWRQTAVGTVAASIDDFFERRRSTGTASAGGEAGAQIVSAQPHL